MDLSSLTDMKSIVWSRKMAAIIAQITREHRERIARRKQTYPMKKSRYILPPFEENFDPKRDVKVIKVIIYCIFPYANQETIRIPSCLASTFIGDWPSFFILSSYWYSNNHHRFNYLQYLRWRPKIAHRQKIQARVDELVSEEVKKKDIFDATRVTKCGMVCEIIIIIFSISLVPFLVLTVYLIWPV